MTSKDIQPVGYCVWISPTKLASCAKSAKGAFPIYSGPADLIAADFGVNVEPSCSADLDMALSLMDRCAHDGGFDREIGPIGCYLGDKCVCIGIYPLVASARASLSKATA
jgi:hypothetical protein